MSNIQRKKPLAKTPAASSSSLHYGGIPLPTKGETAAQESKRISAWLAAREGTKRGWKQSNAVLFTKKC